MAATLEQIATEAGVSPPTVTNYYGSKQEILLALLNAPDERSIRENRATLMHRDPIEALCAIELRVAENQLATMPASLWRELAPFWLQGELSEVFQPWNDMVIAEIRHIFSHYQESGQFRQDLDVEVTARLFNDIMNLGFLRLASAPVPNFVAHEANSRVIIELFCRGMLAKS